MPFIIGIETGEGMPERKQVNTTSQPGKNSLHTLLVFTEEKDEGNGRGKQGNVVPKKEMGRGGVRLACHISKGEPSTCPTWARSRQGKRTLKKRGEGGG